MKALLFQLEWELRKLVARRRTWLGFAAIAGFELVFILLLQDADVRLAVRRLIERIGYTAADNFTGLTVAHFLLGHTLALAGAIAMALTAGDVVAGEDDEGVLRMVLCRPVSRWSLLAAKWLACCLHMAAIVIFTAALSLGLGLAFEGPGQLLVHDPDSGIRVAYAFADGLLLYAWAAGLLLPSNLTIVCLAFFFSCLKFRPATATVLTILLLAADDLLRHMPFFASLRPWFLMTRITGWQRVYVPSVGWSWLVENYTPLLGLDAMLLLAAGVVFTRRDFKP